MATTSLTVNPYLHDPDVQLMLRAKDGDDQAFAMLVDSYQDRLVSIFYNLVHDQQSAEDLAQEVFFRIYRAKNGYKATAKFSTWLYRIANNLASNARRSKSRRKEVQFAQHESTGSLEPRSAEALLKEKSALMPMRQIDDKEMREAVLRAIDQLNDRQRMAVLLHKFEDMSYADIAETLEMTIMGVKSLLSRARENMRVYLENYLR